MTGETRKLKVREAAAFLGISFSYLNMLRVKGGGPAFLKFGRAVCYDRGDLQCWAAQNRRSSSRKEVSAPTRVDELAITVRTAHALLEAGIETIDDLRARSAADLLRIPNFGRKSLNEVRDCLHGIGHEDVLRAPPAPLPARLAPPASEKAQGPIMRAAYQMPPSQLAAIIASEQQRMATSLEWKPMSSAPKDGRPIIGLHSDLTCDILRWGTAGGGSVGGWWDFQYRNITYARPIAWIDLPAVSSFFKKAAE